MVDAFVGQKSTEEGGAKNCVNVRLFFIMEAGDCGCGLGLH